MRNHSNIFALILCLALIAVEGGSAIAQPKGLNEGNDPHRTRLIPYHSSESAAAHSLDKQRYMEPITEWERVENTLRGEFTYPFSWVERQIFLRIEQVGQPYEVFVNGKRAGGSTNGHAPAEYNITKLSHEDKNRVEVHLKDGEELRAIECFEMPKCGEPKVYILSQPRVRVRDVSWRATQGMGGIVNADFSVVMHNQTLGQKSARLYYELYLNDTIRLTTGHLDLTLGMYGIDTMRFGGVVPDSMLWNSATPHQLSLRLRNRIAGRDIEFYDLPVAMRELRYENGEFYINGTRCAMEWIEMSPSVTIEDITKTYENGHRAIRFTAGGVGDETLTLCDKLGIYVALTAPIDSSSAGESRKRGGNPSNNPKWRDEYTRRTLQMIHTTKRHPSVVAYYLAQGSANGICLYESYLAAKAVAGERAVLYTDGGNEWNSDR